ncbi:MAG: sulfotransferase [Rhodospirillales bacterium]|nr:sulfotransferase [Rhodospirillales bacterium]
MNGVAERPLRAWDRPVFVLTTGRSGSTLLLRYLNCAKDLVVWGEHAAILTELAACYAKLTKPSTMAFVAAAEPWVDSLLCKSAVVCASDQMTIEWANSFSAATIRESFRNFLFSLLNQRMPGELRWGFKEIHYGRREMNFLRELFAGARFLVLVRHPANVLKSKFTWFAMRDVARMQAHFDQTLRFYQFAHEEAASRNSDTMLVHYEDLAATPAAEMARVAAFLDAELLDGQLNAIIRERSVSPATDRDNPEDALRGALGKIDVTVDEVKMRQLADLYRGIIACSYDRQPGRAEGLESAIGAAA